MNDRERFVEEELKRYFFPYAHGVREADIKVAAQFLDFLPKHHSDSAKIEDDGFGGVKILWEIEDYSEDNFVEIEFSGDNDKIICKGLEKGIQFEEYVPYIPFSIPLDVVKRINIIVEMRNSYATNI